MNPSVDTQLERFEPWLRYLHDVLFIAVYYTYLPVRTLRYRTRACSPILFNDYDDCSAC